MNGSMQKQQEIQMTTTTTCTVKCNGIFGGNMCVNTTCMSMCMCERKAVECENDCGMESKK